MNWPGAKRRVFPVDERKSERVSEARSKIRSTRALSVDRFGAVGKEASAVIILPKRSFFGRLAHLVDRIARDDDHDFRVGIVDHSLASEARGRRESGRLVEQVFLLLARFA